jgi:predicted DNA-binding protein (MmcQ/YjbR family)
MDELHQYALSLPESKEAHPWGETVVKVKGKVFVFLGRGNDGPFGVSVKLPESHQAALTMPFTAPTEYGLGKSGWVDARFSPGDQVPVGLLKGWIYESYCAIAPKRVLQQVAGGEATKRSAGRPRRR